MESAAPKNALRFGLYEADLSRGTLTRQGARVKLQEQPFRILATLLLSPGQLVTREQLRRSLWAEGTHVNYDGSLNAALKKLRAALQDDSENPVFIETVPRQGYRFLAPVQIVEHRPNEPTGTSESSEGESLEVWLHLEPEFSPERAAKVFRERHREEQARRWMDTALLALAIVFGSWLLFFVLYPYPRPSVQRMTRITNAPGIDEWGGIVSDGSRIFFLHHTGGRWRLMQTSVEGGNAEMMPAPFEGTRLFGVSPDHSQFLIGQFTRRDDEMPLWLWPVQGGAPRRIGDATGHDPAWSPDGAQIVFVRDRSLFTVRADGSDLRELARMKSMPHWPAWSPDGSRIRFNVDQQQDDAQAIWEMNADGSSVHMLRPAQTAHRSQTHGQWTADGRYFLFTGCQGRDCNLWAMREDWSWLRRSHFDPFPITQGPETLHVALPAQTSSRVFAFSLGAHRQMWKVNAGTGETKGEGVASQAEGATVAPDGNSVVYSARADGILWESRLDGTHALQLTKSPLAATAPRWSRDGSTILFTGAQRDELQQIYTVRADGGGLRAVLPARREALTADWSPDGSQIVVSMRDHQTQSKFGIYLFRPGTGDTTLLPDSRGLIQPRWSPDGRLVAALDDSRRRLLLYDFQVQKWRTVATGVLLDAPEFSRNSRYLYYQDTLGENEAIFRADLRTAALTRVYDFREALQEDSTRCTFQGIATDGSLYVTIEHGVTEIYALDLDLP